MMISNGELLTRLVLSCILGGIIGYERQSRRKSAGGGFYSGALITTALVFVTLGTLSKLDEWVDHEKNFSLSIHTIDRPGQMLRINNCLEGLHLRIRSVKIKSDDFDDGRWGKKGRKYLFIDLEVYNPQGVKGVIVVDAVRSLEGVQGVDLI